MKNCYTYDKEKLPRPILEGHEDFIKLYYDAWRLAFKNIEYIDKEGWKDILTCMPGVGIMWQWDSCIMTFITNYSNGTLSAFNNLDNLFSKLMIRLVILGGKTTLKGTLSMLVNPVCLV